MSIELSVIIVNYNGLNYLKDNFESLERSLKGIKSEIIVFDNNSEDESCLFITNNYPKIQLIKSNRNFGFGKANNKAVQQSKGKYLLLLNNDTILIDEVSPILETLKADNSIGVIGIKMVNKDNEYLPSAGNFPNYQNMFRMKKLSNINRDFKTGIFTKNLYEVDWLSGSFLLLSKETYDKINGFDQDYFLYVEDVDFSKKIAQIGLKRVFLSNFKYIHFVGFNSSKNYLLIKGFETYISKHFHGFTQTKMQFVLKLNKLVKSLK